MNLLNGKAFLSTVKNKHPRKIPVQTLLCHDIHYPAFYHDDLFRLFAIQVF